MRYPFEKDNFESFLSEQANQHRLYPGDRVWRKIQENLHGKDRWPALTFASILTGSIIAVILTFIHPDKQLFDMADYQNQNITLSAREEAGKSSEFGATEKNTPTEHSVFAVAENDPSLAKVLPFAKKSATGMNDLASTQPIGSLNNPALNETPSNQNQFPGSIDLSFEDQFIEPSSTDLTKKEIQNFNGYNAYNFNANNINENAAANILPDAQSITLINPLAQPKENEDNVSNTNLAKLSKAASRKSKWAVSYYLTPSISYRYLLDNNHNEANAATGPLAPYLIQDVNTFVNHNSKMGLEGGVGFIYKLADNFRVKTGIQLNYRQFGVQAYLSNAAPAILSNASDRNPLVRYTDLSNQSGYKPIELTNRFVQLAIPVGFDLKIASSKKVDFYLSAANQFTYQVVSSNYLLSADFKNYVKEPSLDRHFNVNTAIEAFASFKAGGINWQVGPQIRYQLMPGTLKSYPIREHLVDYGIKVGVVKTLK